MPPPSADSGLPLSSRTQFAIAGLGLTQIVGYGTTYYLLGLLGGLIMQELGLSQTTLMAGVSLTLLASALLGPYAGRWQDRRGSRLPMTIGSLLMGAGLLILAAAGDAWLYFIGWAIIALGSPVSLYSACFTALAQMAGPAARRAIVLLTLIGGLASSIAWPITAWMLTIWNWREIVFIFGVVNIAICAPLHALLLDGTRRAEISMQAVERVPPGLPPPAQPRAFAYLTTMLSAVSLVGNAWSMLAIAVLVGLGFDAGIAVLIASAVGVFQVVGRIGELAAGNRHSPLSTGQISNLLYTLAFAALALSSGNLLLGLAFATCYGVANGLNTIVKGTLTLAIFGSAGYGERLGKVTLIPGLAAAVAPILGGVVMDGFGVVGLQAAFGLCAFAGFLIMLLLARHCQRHGLT